MKLNNKGWGTMEMILLVCGLLIALIVAIFFISKLYGSLNSTIGNKDYFELETKIESAAKEYVRDNNIQIDGERRISYETLKENNKIDNLYDQDNNSCTGYVTVTRIDNINYYKGYISCPGYITDNY